MSSGSESPCCSSTLSSEHESTSGTLPMRKMEIRSGPGGKFKASWKLPQFITASTKGDQIIVCITDLVLEI